MHLRLWAHETTSAITETVHFGEFTEKEGHQTLEKLDALGVRLLVADIEQNYAAFDWTLRLKRATVYDSYYLGWPRYWRVILGSQTNG